MVNSTMEVDNLLLKKRTYQEIIFHLDFINKLGLERMINMLITIEEVANY